ncbi:MAG: Mannose-6-phosphate isomerase [Pseudomonadota bacterium]|jgi:Mannose-6-phosphate isomerase
MEYPGKIPLELIEVQVGSYLGEDDIVHFEARYTRPARTASRYAPATVRCAKAAK